MKNVIEVQKLKILVINEKYHYGGAEIQSKREVKNLIMHGHEACMLTFDERYSDGYIDEYCFNISIPENRIAAFFHECVRDKEAYHRILVFLSDYRPDFIHLNNTDKHALAIYRAIRNYPCFQTVRDYSVVCPTGLSVCTNFAICKGYKSLLSCCRNCLFSSENKAMVLLKFIRFWIRSASRRKYVKSYACPSQMLTNYCNQFGLQTECINNPFDFTILEAMELEKRKYEHSKIFLYYGEIVAHKGIDQLVKAFSKFAKGKNDVQLHLVGKVNPKYEQEFELLLEKNRSTPISYLGKMEYSKIISKLMTVHTVVVPSLWIENYPNTALEAVSCGCLVLGSERGGMREIIGDDRYIFNILDEDDIVEKLQFAYEHSTEEYERVTSNRQTYVRNNNSLEMYYQRLMKKIQKIK